MKKNPFEHIATPDQIPNSISDESFQAEELRTNSMREFSNQIKDLTARLSVQIRRNSELETQVKKLAGRIINLKEQNEEISNNSLKNRQIANFHQEEMEKVNEQLKQTEIDLGQLSLLHRNLEQVHEQGLTKTDTKLRRFERYHSRIQKIVRPKINLLVEQNINLLSQLRDLKVENEINNDKFVNTKNILDREKFKQKSKLNQAADLQEEIIGTYESEFKQLRSLLDQREIELADSENRRRYLENMRDKYVVMENKAIAAERMRFEIEKKYDSKISELRSSIIELKDSHESEKKDFESQKVLLDTLKSENDELSKKYFDSATIASTARGDSQAKYIQIEQVRASKKSLEKQVLELQEQIRSQRTENKKLREELSLKQEPPKIPSILPEEMEIITDLNEVNEEPVKLDNLDSKLELSELDFEEMGEIDRLIKEIETGYPIKPNQI